MSSGNTDSSDPKQTRRTTPVVFLLGCLFTLLLIYAQRKWSETPAGPPDRQEADNEFTINRLNGYKNTRPVLSIEQQTESASFLNLKKDLVELIDSLKRQGTINQASVYFREFDKGAWTSVNPEEQYHPASLMKVALLMCYLKIAESDPSILRKEFEYKKPPATGINPQYYAAPTIQPGKKYSIHELLYYMIAYSDNNATWLLASHFDNARLKKLFAEFGLPEPVEDDLKFTMTPKEYSVFFKAIYNSPNMSPEFAEYAADLLSECSFQEGFARGFPKNTKMYHKFGEWRSAGQDFELHESGVFFINDRPYLLTVMTRGNDTPKLADAISAIAGKVYVRVAPP